MHAWQFAKANYIAENNGWSKFVSMQDLYNLLYREEEREMIPLLKDKNIAMTPWSPLAQGRLARDVGVVTDRSKQETMSKEQEDYAIVADNEVIKRCHELADEKGISRGQVAMAWVLSKDYVTSPLVGATKVKYLEDAVGALDVELTEEEIAYLEEPYLPHKVVGYR